MCKRFIERGKTEGNGEGAGGDGERYQTAIQV